MYEITDKDREDYPYIVGYCHYLGSSEFWIWDQVRMAREHNAPRTATRVWIDRQSGKPVFGDVSSLSSDGLRLLVIEMESRGLDCHEIAERLQGRDWLEKFGRQMFIDLETFKHEE
ncbi:hypothetical protein [Nonomuraea jabiensis]|uniref:hypothetical protein n=1 Tax=Nonomuraea jabiensis TaxID=882448 RepID=UPI003D71D0DE